MFNYPKHYDVIVIGGGHAGIEAALASARMGCEVLLLTSSLDSIGQMSCNPAIGGLAKGHLVREIDALGGEMGIATDLTGIQFRMLNTTKGPAVWAPRAQCDKKAYQARMKLVCERQEGLDIRQDSAEAIVSDEETVLGVRTALGIVYLSRTVVVTTGTFLRGLIHVGEAKQSGGRFGEQPSVGLSSSLVEIGLEIGRFKTGTPPRVLRRSLDFSAFEPQLGDEPPPLFSHWHEGLFHVEHASSPGGHSSTGSCIGYPPGSLLAANGGQVRCFITHTTPATAACVRQNLHKSPLYSGAIHGVGPRYCPSIEDKIVRFSERERHQIFLEPEGLNTEEVYINGLSTSLPFQVQLELVRSLPGCERAEIVRPAYAVEYDYFNPTQLRPTLESKLRRNLFLAGQINGTSGYEEAAAQGIMAGINAALRVKGRPPFVLRRDQAYIGVLIDDLITKGTSEPYRMFTSRAEHRLLLRQDNADLRLSSFGFDLGLISGSKMTAVERKRQAIQDELRRLASSRAGSSTLLQLLRRPEVRYTDLPGHREDLPEEVRRQVELHAKYEGYISRQEAEVSRLHSIEEKHIPDSFDYSAVAGLRTEARQKLSRIRPVTVGQAMRISGVSPADVSLLLVWLKRVASSEAESDPSPVGHNLAS
jgi:tRNA uridine 5-carboxymethylaminomethyl modification enzyme